MWVLGQSILRKYYSVFDARRWRIGLAVAKHSTTKREERMLATSEDGGKAKLAAHQPERCVDDDKHMQEQPFSLPGCQSFASMGYCHRFVPLAKHYCRHSCSLCNGGNASKAISLAATPPKSQSAAQVKTAITAATAAAAAAAAATTVCTLSGLTLPSFFLWGQSSGPAPEQPLLQKDPESTVCFLLLFCFFFCFLCFCSPPELDVEAQTSRQLFPSGPY
mmetsp:Transcript_2629/g.3474  ORF Transcript_2629/g.3474 Transcript_2629/m.3474 type:complete len:220 (+) Transcript_2629:22-681(+)